MVLGKKFNARKNSYGMNPVFLVWSLSASGLECHQWSNLIPTGSFSKTTCLSLCESSLTGCHPHCCPCMFLLTLWDLNPFLLLLQKPPFEPLRDVPCLLSLTRLPFTWPSPRQGEFLSRRPYSVSKQSLLPCLSIRPWLSVPRVYFGILRLSSWISVQHVEVLVVTPLC